MSLTEAQIKGRIKNVAKANRADARILMRIYMMERFLERVANSRYSNNFIIKGGILVTAMVGVSMRSTMDIDTSLFEQQFYSGTGSAPEAKAEENNRGEEVDQELLKKVMANPELMKLLKALAGSL